MRKSLSVIVLCTLSLAVQADELYTSRAVVEPGAGHQIEAKLRFSGAVQGDMYLATAINKQFLFIGPNGVTPEVQAYMTDQVYDGEYRVLNVPAAGLEPGRYPLYHVTVVPGGNVFNVNDWVDGFAGLNVLNFAVGLPAEQHGDHDGDGFPDNDNNRDGFHDDDTDLDGYHDDDADRDGYHDDDHDRNGYHDNDNDRDGHADESNAYHGAAQSDKERPHTATSDSANNDDGLNGDMGNGTAYHTDEDSNASYVRTEVEDNEDDDHDERDERDDHDERDERDDHDD